MTLLIYITLDPRVKIFGDAVYTPLSVANFRRLVTASVAPRTMRHIVDLSTELLELTISIIPGPRDLFSLALTCKRLHNLIVPYHLYFREIVTTWGNDFQVDCALWKTISQRPMLAHHTQTLHFVLPSSTHIGLGLAKSRARVLENVEWTQGDLLPQDVVESIPKSVCKMVNLRIFIWHGRISTYWSCVDNIFDGLANCLNLTSLIVGTGRFYTHPFQAQLLSVLTTLALIVPCLCESCASISFYKKLLLETLETLQDVELQLPGTSIHGELPVSSQWNDVFETVNWPNIRRLTWWLNGHNLRTSLSGPNPILETFIARHPLMESLAYFGHGHSVSTTLDFSFALENPSKLHNLKYICSNCHYIPDIKELNRVCDLQFAKNFRNSKDIESMGSLPNIRFCSLSTRSQRFVTRFVQLFPEVEKLDINLEKLKQSSISEMSNYIAKLKGLNKLTHLSGLLSSHTGHENDRFLKIAADTLPSLTHVEVCHDRQVWALIERNAEGDYMDYKVTKWYHDGPPAWGLFFFGISESYDFGRFLV